MMVAPGLRWGRAALMIQNGRVDVGLHGPVEELGGEVGDAGDGVLAAGVADEDVEAAELGYGVGDEFLAEGFVAQIAGEGDGFAAGLADEVHDFAGVGLFGGEVVDGDVGAFAGVGDGGARVPCRSRRR